jgi:hypothetical protein
MNQHNNDSIGGMMKTNERRSLLDASTEELSLRLAMALQAEEDAKLIVASTATSPSSSSSSPSRGNTNSNKNSLDRPYSHDELEVIDPNPEIR